LLGRLLRRRLLCGRLLALLRHGGRLLADAARTAHALGIGVQRRAERDRGNQRPHQEFSAN